MRWIRSGWMGRSGAIVLILVLRGLPTTTGAKEIEMVMPGPENASQVRFSDPLHGVAMGVHAKGTPGTVIVWTENGGDDWNDATIDSPLVDGEAEALFMADSQRGWALMCGGNPRGQALLNTEDGGKSWKSQPAPELEKLRLLGQIWFDPQLQRGWINTYGGPIWKTEDGGKSWQTVPVVVAEGTLRLPDGTTLPQNFEHQGIHAFSADHLILCGYAGAIVETTDAGQTWKGQQVPLELTSERQMRGGLTAIHFTADGRAGWAIGGEGDFIQHPNGWTQLRQPVVLSTTDAGKTWQHWKVDIRGPLNDVWAISDQEAWICGLGGYGLQRGAPGCLRHTVDGGKTWIDEHPGNNGLRKLFFLDAEHGWVAGGQGGGLEPASLMILIRP